MILQPVRGGGSAPQILKVLCQSTDAVGDVVSVSGPPVGGLYQVSRINIDSSPVQLPLGVVISKLSPTEAMVQISGEVKALYSGLVPGAQVFVDTNSRLTQTPPPRPGSGRNAVHPTGLVLASDTVLLRVQAPTVQVAG